MHSVFYHLRNPEQHATLEEAAAALPPGEAVGVYVNVYEAEFVTIGAAYSNGKNQPMTMLLAIHTYRWVLLRDGGTWVLDHSKTFVHWKQGRLVFDWAGR